MTARWRYRPAGAVAACVVLIALVATASALGAAGRLNLLTVEGQFMCTSCHEPLVVVSSPEAISEKQFIQALIDRGDDVQQIRTAMVGQYGEQVLARPPASGFNLLIYILPPALLLGGLGLLAYTLPRWRERSRRASQARTATGAPLSRDEENRLEDELTKFI